MRDHDDGHAQSGLQFAEEREDLVAVPAVEVAGRLVGEEDRGPVDESAGDGSALLLAAGEFAGTVTAALGETDAFEGFGHAGRAFAAANFVETKGQFDIFLESHAGEEIKGLEDHSRGLAAVAGKLDGGEFGEVTSQDSRGHRR